MFKQFEAVYENGVLRPLEDPQLRNNQHVTVSVVELSLDGQDMSGYFSPQEWETAISDTVTLEQARQALSSIPGCLSDTVSASREDR